MPRVIAPAPSRDDEYFWTGVAEERLLARECAGCGYLVSNGGASDGGVSNGMRVEVTFEEVGGVKLPQFRPAAGEGN